LQESDELPKNFTTLFNEKLYKFDTDLIPETLELYETVGVKHEPLTLIPP
jgi:intraflagellar transport protein 52